MKKFPKSLARSSGAIAEASVDLTQPIRKGYRPEARGYVIYSPPRPWAKRKGNKSHNHELKADNGLFSCWHGFLKGGKNTMTKNASIGYLSFVF